MENGSGQLQAIPTTYTMEFEPHVDSETTELEVDTKPKMEKKMKKKIKMDSASDDDVIDNKLEDNPAQVINIFRFTHPRDKQPICQTSTICLA